MVSRSIEDDVDGAAVVILLLHRRCKADAGLRGLAMAAHWKGNIPVLALILEPLDAGEPSTTIMYVPVLPTGACTDNPTCAHSFCR